MMSAEFHEAVAFALSCVGRQDLTLTVKPKQEEALVQWLSCLLGSLLAMGSRRAISCWSLCITSN